MAIENVQNSQNVVAQRTDPQESPKKAAETRAGGVGDEQVAVVDVETISKAIDANRAVVFGSRSLEFSFDKESGRVIVKVRAEGSDEVVRQIPPEEYLRFVARFKEALGVLFDEVV